MKTTFAGLSSLVRVSLLQLALPVIGAEVVWTNTSGGNWNASSNWLGQVVPGAGDNVYITNAGTYTVTLNTSATIQSLVLGGSTGTQRLTNSTAANVLSLGGASSVELSGVLGMANGTLTGSGDLTLNGTFVWTGGILSGLGQLNITSSGDLIIAGTGLKTLSGRPVANSGHVDWSGTGDIAFNVGVFTNMAAGVIELQNNEPIADRDGTASTATLYNFGTIRKVTGTATSTFTDVTLQNDGSLSVQSGTLTLAGPFNNAGKAEVLQGTLNLTEAGIHSGVFEAASVGAVTFSAGAPTFASGTQFTGPGTHRIATTVTATLTGPVGASTFEMTGGTLTGSGDLTVTNVLHWSGGTWSGSGAINLPPAAVLTIDGAPVKVLSGRTVNLSGSAAWTGAGAVQFNSGVFNILSGGLLDIQNDELFSDVDGANTTATLNTSPAGVLRKSVGTLSTSFTGVILNNSGTVDAQSGTLSVAGGTSTGRFEASNVGAILTFAGGTQTLQDGAQLVGPGLHRVNGSTATLAIAGVAGANRFELALGTITSTGTFTVSNNFSWTGGTLAGSGTVLLPPASVASLSGTTVKVLNGPTLRNGGAVTWTGTGDLQIPAGTWDNQAGAVFDAQNGEILSDTDGAATPAVFQNAGTFRKSVGTTATTVNALLFNNTGLVEVQSGTLSLAGGTSSGLFTTGAAGTAVAFATGTHNLEAGAACVGPGVCRLTGSATTLAINGAVGMDRFEIASGTLTGTGSLTVTNSLDWLGGTLSGAGVTTVAAAGALNISGTSGRNLNGRTLINRGAAVWSGTGGLVFNSGLLQNTTGASFEAQNDRTISDNDGGATAAVILNEGSLRKTVGTGTTALNGVALNNAGVVEVQSGTLSLAGGTSTGTFNVSAPAAVLAFAAGTNILGAGAVLQGSGVFALSGSSTALTLMGNVTASRLDMSGGTLAGSGTLTMSSAFNWSGGALSGAGSLDIPAAAVLNVGAPFSGVTLAGRTINNSGRTIWSGAADIIFENGVFNNLPGAVFEMQSDRSLTDNDGATTVALFRNSGVIQKTTASGQTTFFGIVLTNSGSINVTNWSLYLNGPFSNDGLCTVGNGTLIVQGDGSSAGVFSTVSPSGRIAFYAGNQQWRDGTRLVGTGTNEIQSATIDVAGTVGIDNLELSGGGTISGAGTLNVSNSFRWTSGSLAGTGSTTILPAATLWLNGNGNRTLDGRTVSNQGTAHIGGASSSLYLNRGTLRNESGALFDVGADAIISDTDGSATPALFHNAGTLRCSSTTPLTSIDALTLTNSGSIQVLAGALQISGPFHHTGLCALTNATLSLAGGGTIAGAFDLDAASAGDFASGDFAWNGGTAFGGGGVVRLSGATVSTAASLPIARLQQDAGTLTGSGTVTVGGVFNWTGGTQSGSGTTAIGPGASLNLTNLGSVSLNGRALRNSGTAVSTGSALSQGILFNSGLVENLANAIFEVQGQGGFYDFDGSATVPEFRNAGKFIRTGGGTASFAGVTLTNSGTVTLDAGSSQFGNYFQGAGSTTLAGSMSASGVNLNGGTLTGAGTIQCVTLVNSALISPGASPGAITILGPYLQTPQGKLAIEVGGSAFALFDSLQVSGTATVAGQLDVSIINGYQPAANDFIPILTASLVSGEFTSVTGGAVSAGQALRPEYTANSVLLRVRDATNSTPTLYFSAPTLQANGNVLLTLNGTANATFILQASTNLTTWINLVSVTNPGPVFLYTVTNTSAFPARFFRARQ